MLYTNCIVPGDNARIVPEPKDTGPPEGFIDNTVRVYKMNLDGSKGELLRTEDPFHEGWDRNDFVISNKIESEERRGREMTGNEKPVPENIKELWVEVNYSVNALAKKCNVGWIMAKKWLVAAGLIDSFGKPLQPQEKKVQTSDPAPAANQEPDQSEASADTSIAEMEITVKDVLLYEVEQQDDFTVDDDEPIPYKVFDLAPVKIQLIAAALAEYRAEQLPAFIALRLVKAIGDIELGVE